MLQNHDFIVSGITNDVIAIGNNNVDGKSPIANYQS